MRHEELRERCIRTLGGPAPTLNWVALVDAMFAEIDKTHRLTKRAHPKQEAFRGGGGPKEGRECPYKGVYADRRKFVASIWESGKNHVLGRFDTAEEAAKLRDKAAFERWGEKAWLNRDHFDLGASNVRDCGVIGDGATDDTVAIQAAIDSYEATGAVIR